MKRTPLKRKPLPRKKTQIKRTGLQRKPGWKTRTYITKTGKKVKKVNSYWKQVFKTDRLFSVAVRLIAADENGIVTCFTCGRRGFWKYEHMECGHYKGRGNMNTRWDFINNEVQCAIPGEENCNRILGGNLKVYRENLIKKHGLQIVEDLERRANETKKWTLQEMKELRSKLTKMIKQIRLEKGL